VKTYGALMAFCWASTSSVEVSNNIDPETKDWPSGATERMGEAPAMLRLESTMEEATSYTKTVRVLLASILTPMIVLPLGVASRRLLPARYIKLLGGGNCGVVGAAGATITVDRAWAAPALGSKVIRTFCPVPVPMVAIRTCSNPWLSRPTATPSGLAESVTERVEKLAVVRSMMSSAEAS
jgi:hypothetical protein